MLMTLKIEGLRLQGRHGVLDSEKRNAQDFIIDAELIYDAEEAVKSDDIGQAVDYGEVIGVISEAFHVSHFELIESIAHDIAKEIRDKFETVKNGSVTVRKAKPPLEADVQGVSATVEV